MSYNPENPIDRLVLADQIKVNLRSFVEASLDKQEVVYQHTLASGRVIRVYTSIQRTRWGNKVEDIIATSGADAIRVVALAPDKNRKLVPILPKQRRVYRTGEMDEICQRMHAVIKEVVDQIKPLGKCASCGGYNALSKAGKSYCLDRCWIKKTLPAKWGVKRAE